MDPRAVFDAHFHIIDPRFRLVPNRGFLPAPYPCADYLGECAALGLQPEGGAVVSGSFQAFDQDYLVAALAELGSGFVGVTQLPPEVPDARLVELHQAGVRAVRFNLYRGITEDLRHLDTMARRVYETVGWHVELYVDSTQLPILAPALTTLPRVSIDHLGLSREGYGTLLRLVEAGVRVKASGFSRTDLDVPGVLREIDSIHPGALMYGSDLPCTRAPRRFTAADLAILEEALDESALERVLRRNAQEFYLGETG